MDINLGLTNGYTIVKAREALVYSEIRVRTADKPQEGLFTKFVDACFAKKVLASKHKDVDYSSEESKKEFCRKYYEREGVELDHTKLEPNPALCAVNKLILNSSYGLVF